MDDDSSHQIDTHSSFLQYRPLLLIACFGIVLVVVGLRILTSQKEPEIEFIEAKEASQSSVIKIDLAGAVNKPGVYTLSVESRIEDLLKAGGGLGDEADLEWVARNLNLAAKLKDGNKIYIPQEGEIGENKNAENAVINENYRIININLASQIELEALPGIGAVTAQEIISNRPYQDISDLKTKKIVGQATFEKIKDHIGL